MSVVPAAAPAHLDALLSKLTGVKTEGDHWKALCPAHNDRNPSLGIALGRDSRVLLTCYAGCGIDSILDAIGLSVTDLFADAVPIVAPEPQIVTHAYIYQNERREPAYRVLRLHPKSFKQQRPDGRGGWMFGLNGTEPVLYRLPELIEADPRQPVFKCAGEKDVDRLVSMGLVATTNPMGEGKTDSAWRPQYSHALRDRSVVILADNDAPGLAHAHFVAGKLHGVARKVRVIVLPGLPDHGDVSDWLDAGHTKQELAAIVKDAPVWEPESMPVITLERTVDDNTPSDLGNAQRLVQRHGDDLRYCYKWGSWLVWNGASWTVDDGAAIERRAKDTVKAIYVEAADLESSAARKGLAAHALKSESAQRIRAMIDLARSEEGVPIAVQDMDTAPLMLNVENGIVDLTTGVLHPHDRSRMMTRTAPVRYDLDARCPLWESFLDTIMDGDEEVIGFLKRALGYSITGIATERVMFIMHGIGRNGKSTIIETINAILGDYSTRSPSDMLLARKGDAGIPNDIARLPGIRFTFASETGENGRLDEARIKDITSGDTLSARFLHQNLFEFRPQFKIWLATNHKPVIRGSDKAIWDRIRLIPFNIRIAEADADLDLQEKLVTEGSGILNWLIEGCLDWRGYGLFASDAVRNATEGYRSDMDAIGEFLADHCVIDPVGSITAAEMYTLYKRWTEETGEFEMSKRSLGMKLAERGFTPKQVGPQRVRTWIGIRERYGTDQ